MSEFYVGVKSVLPHGGVTQDFMICGEGGPIGYGLLLYNHMRTFVLDACHHSHVQWSYIKWTFTPQQ